MQQANSDWELCKENIQPLKKGRKMETIKSALLEHSDGERRRAIIQQQQRDYEVAIRTYTGDDPLQLWCAYIEWTEQNFPTGGKESRLLDLLQTCISTFHDATQYHNDSRFVGIWLHIADMSPDPVEIYEYMFNQGIGSKSALFYRDWALHLENLGNLKKAEEILHEGLKMTTDNKEELNTVYTNFVTRLTSKTLDSNYDDSSHVEARNQRTTLGGLKPIGKSNHVGPTRTGTAKLNICQGIGTQRPQPIKSNSAVQVHCDENDPMAVYLYKSNCKAMPFAISDSKKENEMKPAKWTQVKVKQKECYVRSSCKFPVHVDEAYDQPLPVAARTPAPTVLRNIAQPTVLKAVQQKMTNDKNDCQRIMYCKEKLYRGITEFQFEELRAVKWWENRRKLEAEQQLRAREEIIRKREEQIRTELECLRNVLGQKNFFQLEEIAKRLELSLGVNSTSDVEGNSNVSNSVTPLPRHCDSSEPKSQDGESTTKHQNSATPHTHTLHFMRALWNDKTLTAASNVLQPTCQNMVDFKPYEDEVCGSTSKDISHPTDTIEKDLDTLQHHASNELQHDKQDISNQSANASNLTPLPEDVFEEDEENIQNIPPKDYIQPSKERMLAGILVPSLNIPYLPVEEQELIPVEGDLNGIEPINDCPVSDFSVTCPSNTVFLSDLKYSSTPNVELRGENTVKEVFESETRFAPKLSCGSLMRGDTMLRKPFLLAHSNGGQFVNHGRDLSAISETSREYKSSSSSGASSGATSHFKSHMLRNEVLVEMSAEEDKRPDQETSELIPTTFPITPLPTNTPIITDFPSDVNPFDPAIIEQIIANLIKPLQDREGYITLPRNMPTIKERMNLILGNDTYFIKQMTATGGFSKVYSGTAIDDDYLMCPKRKFGLAFKVQKPACLWEFYIASEIRQRLQELPSDFNIVTSIMDISKFYVYKNGSILVTDYYANGTLLDISNLYKVRGTIMPECLILYFTLEMLYIMEHLHSCKIIHGDIKPDNFMVMGLPLVYVNGTNESDCIVGNSVRCLKLIDYGRSIDMAAFPPGATFTTVVNTSGFLCHEMQKKQPWTYQTDYYGMACCTHVMMFGAYMKTVKQGDMWKITSSFKRSWNKEVWDNYFNCLLNIPNCNQQPNIQSLRRSLQACLMQEKLLTELPNQIRILADMLPSKKNRQYLGSN